MEAIINYKKRVVSRFIPFEGSAVVSDLPESDEYVYSEKIDGHIAYIQVKDSKVTMYNRSANILELPLITAKFPTELDGIWAGELYLAQPRSRNFQVASAITNNREELRFAVFDAVHLLDRPILERIQVVREMIPVSEYFHPVTWHVTPSRKELLKEYNAAIENGKEGLVVHSSLGLTYKLKPSVELDVTVLGYSMKEDGTGIRSLLVGLYDQDGWVVVATVGGGFNDASRAEWLSMLQALECEADFVMVASNRLAYKWVNPEIVIQIKCIEILTEDSNGQIRKEKLAYQDGNYHYIHKSNACSLVSPILVGIRTDKVPNADDTGIQQVAARVEISPDSGENVDQNIKSDILFREVYIKESATGTAVRKFVGIKTNKDLKHSFTPYILFYTDFSAGRKEPLQTDLRLASDEVKLKEFLAKGIEENIKKGWQKVSSS
jgi:hypothetical protein